MNKIEWIDVELPDSVEVDDFIWIKYDYLWVKSGKRLYLSQNCGESFTRVGVARFVLTNIWHMVSNFFKRYL